jgi:hypothetical protein
MAVENSSSDKFRDPADTAMINEFTDGGYTVSIAFGDTRGQRAIDEIALSRQLDPTMVEQYLLSGKMDKEIAERMANLINQRAIQIAKGK